MLPSIQQLNSESAQVFIETVNTLFETAPPLADRLLAARPYESYAKLIDFAESICLGPELNEQEKLDIINAHPRIGASKANLSAMSLREQGYTDRQAAVSNEDEQVNAELARLNQEYEDKYGFNFVVFVAGRPRAQIIPVIKERMASGDRQKEMVTGMTDMMLIARDRLQKAAVAKI
ncbi:Oxo-4-hydroxy-4-carboxy-5-ureidoimidazoline decarboxylase [Zychaea mexicana]|uniref:Oxo-4-hydroxy-4-carboxy-5-ureidoimidazoline decarboxylase n=1 Tax=Zychaea mexicana TaxID=64656 RepID=UPI0022FEB902|nr:Oxo-4-hydroxy-4-carboxy-5-ureidoimidazoline decarboxylase [Zychaea mexicana]KAI9484894.1 Oxo-4-hydroxy-4-carboxy-5-ureidoimidazoline decarboxylase [Zychaea mexicana]